MQNDLFERLDTLSQESRQKLNDQIERVQEEARQLRMQARRLRRAQHSENRQRKKLLEQIAQSGKGWGQGVLQRGSELAASGASLANAQLRSGQQKMREQGGNLVQGMSQRGSQVAQNMTDWGNERGERLRKQGQQLTQNATDWGDEAAYKLRKQGQNMLQNMSDWGDEAAHKLRKQGRSLSRNLADRKEETARQLRKQGRSLSRNLTDRKEGTARQLRKQGRILSRNLTGRKEEALRQLRQQRDTLAQRGGQMLEPVRKQSKLWSALGFLSGLLLAGGVTYWLVKRNFFNGKAREEEQQIELPMRETLNGSSTRPAGEIRYANQGGTVVATRPVTSAEPINKFVGVLSTRQYYPINLKPENAQDLVFFETEDDARAEGFSAAG